MQNIKELETIAAMIHTHCGMDYRDNLSNLTSKVSRRTESLGLTLSQYLSYLENTSSEWDALIECITINETYFFREDQQFQEIVSGILPLWKDKPQVSIWCAACSTGEEPYSLAMTIAESGIRPLSSVQILATDINQRVLQVGERGRYPKQSLCFRRTPTEMLHKYFSDLGSEYEVRPELKAAVQFRKLNLLNGQAMALMRSVDIILCRNVLIYFTDETVRGLVDRFYRALTPGGYLFLGHAETVKGSQAPFRTVHTRDTFYYQKEGAN